MKRVVVTGGAGFIGSHLAEELVNRNYDVLILDNLSTGRLENIEELLKLKKAEFVRGDITDLPFLQKHFRGIDYVFHQAALARVPCSIENPVSTNEVNVKGTLNVLLAARDNAVNKVVYASSSSVYGNAVSMPQHEDMALDPLSPYAITKLAGEYYANIFHDLYGLLTASLRYFNVYGPKQDPYSQYATAITAFIGRISQNLPPVIYGDGEQSRDFTFIADVVQANILVAESDASGVYNIGCGQSTSINEVASLILKLMKSNLKPVHEKARPADPRKTLADISKARVFGYKPEWSMERGLKKTVDEFERSVKSGVNP